ncbi:hypothetical protein CsSME_00047587 [Camellia sinensis var. sinensis]
MPQRKIIFTNADKAHAAQVLSRLDLEDCFDGVICFETLNPNPSSKPVDYMNCSVDEDKEGRVPTQGEEGELECAPTDDTHDCNSLAPKSPILCKPSVEAIEAAIRIANVDPKKTIFFDDSARNIASGKAAGLHTVINLLMNDR